MPNERNVFLGLSETVCVCEEGLYPLALLKLCEQIVASRTFTAPQIKVLIFATSLQKDTTSNHPQSSG